MPKKKSAILEAVHETATGLHKAGLMVQTTLHEFDRLCLSPIEPLEPKGLPRNKLLNKNKESKFKS